MAAKTAGAVSVHCRRFGLSGIAATAAGIACVSTRANTPMWIRPPIGPRACRHDRKEACTTRRCRRRRDRGAPAGNQVSHVALADTGKRGGARACGGRPRAIATPTRGKPPAAPVQPRRDA
jgi:hypothetical protein